MQHTLKDVHQQFAAFFGNNELKPFLYLLSRKMADGSTCLDLNELPTEQEDLPEYCHHIAAKLVQIAHSPLVSTEGSLSKPFILDAHRLYLQRYFKYETGLADKIKKLLDAEKDETVDRKILLINEKTFVQNLFPRNSSGEPDWQLAAALLALTHNLHIITGGPGTGKTTTVAKILAVLFHLQPHTKVALAAPTGKAGARMAESLRHANFKGKEAFEHQFSLLQPSTIHRLLGPIKDSIYFKHNHDNPIDADVVIIDESSMIDMALFAKLLDAIATTTRLILLGDKDQLASVEAGSLFGDLCRSLPQVNHLTEESIQFLNGFVSKDASQWDNGFSGNDNANTLFEHITVLQQSHRFDSKAGIGKLSRAVIENNKENIVSFLQKTDAAIEIDTAYEEKIFENFISGYRAYIREKDTLAALQSLDNLRVLCALREGEYGINTINKKIEDYLWRHQLIQREQLFYENRPIIVTKNNYALGLYNGDIGLIRPDDNGIMKVWFPDNAEGNTNGLKSVSPGFISEMETVYAMTIHKSQGSEFKNVMVLLPPKEDNQLLTRELLYTGITRARERVIIQSSAEVLLTTCERKVSRGSGVEDRL